ncbi:MAG: SusD/RagB family nutrient-binding outer membrane lipoprotein [Cytophagales bacterium]|jgi:hypothetical protein|nr:SusD/RagB family nutrient-binding outer membrane lipoprotein [Cytophagales bacterium]
MKKIFFTMTLGLGLFSSACNNFLGDNISPNSLLEAPYPLVFTATQGSTAFHLNSDLFLWSSIFTQQAAGQGNQTQTRFFDQYVVTNGDVNNAFSYFYTEALPDLKNVIEQSTAEGSPAYAGVSRMMQAFLFGVMVDAWGDIPYSEALQGVTNVQPKYDDDRAVYDSLFVLIDRGLGELGQESVRQPSGDDLIYGGDLTKWRRFGNTLKLRLALHLAKVDNGERLRALITATPATDFMTSNDDSFQLDFEDNTNRWNPIHQFELQRADQYFPGEFVVDLMNTNNDPRRAAYFTNFPFDANTFAGAPTTAQAGSDFSRIHTYLRGRVKSPTPLSGIEANDGGGIPNDAITYTGDAPVRMLTYAEYNFIRAEASLVYNATGDAATFYRRGIEASLDEVAAWLPPNVTQADFETQAAAYAAARSAGTPTLEQIIQEKYIANFGVSMEPWTDYRRTGFPRIPVSESAESIGNNAIPRVLPYSFNEQQVNEANVPERPSLVVRGVFWDRP